jgi:carbon monoxide dehydrogenase subunit G
MPPPAALTGSGTTITNAGDPRQAVKGEPCMKLEGAYEVPAPRQKVYEAFLDPKQLKKAIPGCEKLEAIGPDEYKATMKVGVGGVKGTFEGKVRLSDKQPPESYKMAVEGSGGPGFIRGEALISLTETGEGTRVAYSADLQVGGLIASVGQRMLGGVAKMMADKFFTKMGELLEA